MTSRQEETRDYLLDALIDFNVVKDKYPKLKFYTVSARTFILEVAPDATEEFEAFKKNEAQSIVIPILYGLNVQNALSISNINILHDYPLGELRGTGVIVGIIDTGIDYTNPLFTYEDNTTRILSLWDQSIEGEGVQGFSYGTYYTEEVINEALRAQNPLDVVPSQDEEGHGTFLAGVAAGYDRSPDGMYIGAAPDAQLAIVKLRPAKNYLRELYLINEDAIAYQDSDFLAGVGHLVRVARAEAKPLVLCCGLGSNLGGHDGNTVVERYLNEATSFEDIIMVLSAGNEASSGHHYEGNVTQGGRSDFELNVEEGETGVVLSVWANLPDKMQISFITPLGNGGDKIPFSTVIQTFKFPLEPTTIDVLYVALDANSGDELIVVKMKNPTPGIWRFSIYGENIVEGTFNAWIQRSGFINENTRFLKPESFLTLNIPATSQDTLVVGAYNDIDNSIYVASGRGPTRAAVIKPDLVAPGVNILGPTNKGTFERQTGTSVAAAITTGAVALLLEWAVVKGNLNPINTRVVRAILIRGAQREIGVTYPNNITGYGRLDLKRSLESI